jgi:hypothetical protein
MTSAPKKRSEDLETSEPDHEENSEESSVVAPEGPVVDPTPAFHALTYQTSQYDQQGVYTSVRSVGDSLANPSPALAVAEEASTRDVLEGSAPLEKDTEVASHKAATQKGK